MDTEKKEVEYNSVRDGEMFNLDLKTVTNNRDNVKKVFNDVMPSLFEMGQIKSDIDCLLLTGGHEGNNAKQFPASTFHFICRQMRFSISEATRLEREIREHTRRIEKLGDENSIQYKLCEEKGDFPDIEIEKLEQQVESCKIDFFNRATRTIRFKQIHDALVEQNGGEIFTNEDYQKEQPRYYQWFMANRIAQEVLAKGLGINKGLIDANQKLTQEPIVDGITKPIKNYIEIIDREDGHFSFNINFKEIFELGVQDGDVRQLSEQEKAMIAHQQQQLKLRQAQSMFGITAPPKNSNRLIIEKSGERENDSEMHEDR